MSFIFRPRELGFVILASWVNGKQKEPAKA
jgi:hypothetical protein